MCLVVRGFMCLYIWGSTSVLWIVNFYFYYWSVLVGPDDRVISFAFSLIGRVISDHFSPKM